VNPYFEIAYAAASEQLCFFTGTGFSKAVSSNVAPSWQSLLETMCSFVPNGTRLSSELFPASGKNPLPLEEAAQVIQIELSHIGVSLHAKIAELISNIQLAGDNSEVLSFIRDRSFDVISTNYDKLFEQLIGSGKCHSIAPGLPVPRVFSPIRVYHVHGSVDSPEQMVVTSDDYFRFLNQDSYFSRKLSTILHEKTVVILGYSLGDTNLKTILSDYKGFSKKNAIGANIFFISRDKVAQHIKDYYSHSFGIRVLDQLPIGEFFRHIRMQMSAAEACVPSSGENIEKVLYQNHDFKDDYLRVESSFFEITAAISAAGLSINSAKVVSLIGQIIEKKRGFTNDYGAWNQYAHLARWLLHLGASLELRGTSIEAAFLEATLRSMTTMASTTRIGYSWHAHSAWANGWPNIFASNRALIREHIEKNTTWPDALAVVRSA